MNQGVPLNFFLISIKKKDNISTYYNQLQILKILFAHRIFSRAFTVSKLILTISRLTDQTIMVFGPNYRNNSNRSDAYPTPLANEDACINTNKTREMKNGCL